MEIFGVPALRGVRLLAVALSRKARGNRRYEGTASEICEQIVRGCFNARQRYFMTSHSTYAEFWSRDFGRAVPALLGLGFAREVGDTYRYALDHYERAGRFALVIAADGELIDFPAYAPDGFAFFLYGLARLNDRQIVSRHRALLQRELVRYHELVIEPASGLVRANAHFSEAQDYVVRSSSCYSNVMSFLVQRSADELGLTHPLGRYDYKSLLLEHFWCGDHFADDLTHPPFVSGDATILPFWSGVMGQDDAALERFERALNRLDREGLNSPYPSRYGNSRATRRMIPIDKLNPWQRDAVWPCLGLHLIETLARFQPRRCLIETERYARLVERLGHFPEVLSATTGEPFQSPVYLSDDSMLWAANLWWSLRAARRS